MAGDVEVLALETEWVEVSEEGASEMLARADATMGMGFVQRYEDAAGAPVLAVTYWKLGEAQKAPAKKEAKSEAAEAAPPEDEDHTDDLYFRSGRTKPRRGRKRKVDPNQMDLFEADASDD